jgi:hypothetical protein
MPTVLRWGRTELSSIRMNEANLLTFTFVPATGRLGFGFTILPLL